MAFKIPAKQAPTVVKLQEGVQRTKKDETYINQMGMSLELDTEDGGLTGQIRFFAAKTGLSSLQELIDAVEQFVNQGLKATDVEL